MAKQDMNPGVTEIWHISSPEVRSTFPDQATFDAVADFVDGTPAAIMVGQPVLSSSITPELQDYIRQVREDVEDLQSGRITLDDLRARDQAERPELFE